VIGKGESAESFVKAWLRGLTLMLKVDGKEKEIMGGKLGWRSVGMGEGS